MRIGFLGGTFNPPHNGHINLAGQWSRRLNLDRFLITPTGTPPHKQQSDVSGEARLAMCRIAAEQTGGLLEAFDYEVRRSEQKSYSVITLSALHELYPDSEIFMVMGADMFVTLESWYDFDRLKTLATFCTMPRDGIDAMRLEAHRLHLREVGCEGLVADGVVEVMLLGQNVNSYGKNLEEPVTFAQLLQEVEKVDGLQRIRFMTSHPKDLSDDLIQVMKNSSKICHHLHLPLQSGSSRLLKIMNRKYDKEKYLEVAEKLRREIPDLSLTTDIIVGFPGETEEDFQETLDVVRRVRYDSAFTFIYSKRTGTPAAVMENQVPEEIIKDRFDRLLALVQEIGREMSSRLQGKTLPVLVEHVNEQDDALVTGRLENNLVVHFPGDSSMIGKTVDVYLKECHGFYYIGEPAE